jgi:hypothetical protein
MAGLLPKHVGKNIINKKTINLKGLCWFFYVFYTTVQSFTNPTRCNTSMYECHETGTDMPQHVGVAKGYTDVFTVY